MTEKFLSHSSGKKTIDNADVNIKKNGSDKLSPLEKIKQQFKFKCPQKLADGPPPFDFRLRRDFNAIEEAIKHLRVWVEEIDEEVKFISKVAPIDNGKSHAHITSIITTKLYKDIEIFDIAYFDNESLILPLKVKYSDVENQETYEYQLPDLDKNYFSQWNINVKGDKIQTIDLVGDAHEQFDSSDLLRSLRIAIENFYSVTNNSKRLAFSLRKVATGGKVQTIPHVQED